MCNKHKSKKRKYHSMLSRHMYWCGNDEKEINRLQRGRRDL